MINHRYHEPLEISQTDWKRADITLDKQKQALNIFNQPVMQQWEQNFMQKLANIATSRGGNILEIGFGLGLSFSQIQRNKIHKHVIIEANEQVYETISSQNKNKTILLESHCQFWQEVIPNLPNQYFDGILYDTYPSSKKDLHTHQFDFLKQAKRILKPTGLITYCNLTSWGNLRRYYNNDNECFNKTQRPFIHEIGFSNVSYEIVNVNPPNDCEYYSFNTAVAPLIQF